MWCLGAAIIATTAVDAARPQTPAHGIYRAASALLIAQAALTALQVGAFSSAALVPRL